MLSSKWWPMAAAPEKFLPAPPIYIYTIYIQRPIDAHSLSFLSFPNSSNDRSSHMLLPPVNNRFVCTRIISNLQLWTLDNRFKPFLCHSGLDRASWKFSNFAISSFSSLEVLFGQMEKDLM